MTTITMIIADGLDAACDGRGWGDLIGREGNLSIYRAAQTAEKAITKARGEQS